MRLASFFSDLFYSSSKCSKEEVEMDNPAFGQMDPHLKVEESESELEMDPFARMNKFPKKPPSFDALLNNIRAITKKVEHIKGFKFDISGALSNNFHVQHTWNIPNPGGQPQKKMTDGFYILSTQYLHGELKTYMDQPKFIMTGRIDNNGKLEAVIIKKLNDRITCRLNAMYPNSDINYSQLNLDVDIEGEDYCHTIKYGTGLFSFNMMQNVRRGLVLGFELMNLSERKISLMNYALKYTHSDKKNSFYMQYTAPNETLTLAYSLWLKKKAFLVSELEINTHEGETNSIIGYRQKFSHSEIIATLSSKGKISTVLNMTGYAYQLKLCSIANYWKDSYKFGYGITMGQVQ